MKPVGTQSPSHSTEAFIRSSIRGVAATANASVVNRTHRVVRERAKVMQTQRSMMRGLLLPMLLSSTLMLMLLFAVWSVLDQYDIVSSEMPPTSNHFVMLLLWFLPASAALLAMVWVRRSRNSSEAEATR